MQEDSTKETLRSHEKLANINIELYFNNTTPPERVAEIGIYSLLATANAAFLLNPSPDKMQKDRILKTLHIKLLKFAKDGEGEWKVKQHGPGKRRKWRKLHIGLEPKTGQIQVYEAIDSNESDTEVRCKLIRRLKKVKKVYGDGAYDTTPFIEEVLKKGGSPIIPPRKIPILRKEPSLEGRNNSILEIIGLGGKEEGLELWKKLKKYHTRTLALSWFSRYKRILTGSLRSKVWRLKK